MNLIKQLIDLIKPAFIVDDWAKRRKTVFLEFWVVLVCSLLIFASIELLFLCISFAAPWHLVALLSTVAGALAVWMTRIRSIPHAYDGEHDLSDDDRLQLRARRESHEFIMCLTSILGVFLLIASAKMVEFVIF